MTQPRTPHTNVGIHLPTADCSDPVALGRFVVYTEQPFVSVDLGAARLYVNRPADFDALASLFTKCAAELRHALADVEEGQECDGCPGLFPVDQMEPIGSVVLCPTCRQGVEADISFFEEQTAGVA